MIYTRIQFFYYSGPDSQKQYEANLLDWVLLFWENIPCTICIRYLCWEWHMMFKCTCWDRTSQSLRSPPGPELHRKTWAYRAEATGSQSLSWCDRLENKTEHHEHHVATQNYLYTIRQKIKLKTYRRWPRSAESPHRRCLTGTRWGLGACGTAPADGWVWCPGPPASQTETETDLL